MTPLPQKSGSRRSSHRLPFGVGRLKDCSLNRFCGFPVGFIPQRSFKAVEIPRYKMHLPCKTEALFLRPCRQKCKLPSISPADRSASGSSEPVSGAMHRPLSSRFRAAYSSHCTKRNTGTGGSPRIFRTVQTALHGSRAQHRR